VCRGRITREANFRISLMMRLFARNANQDCPMAVQLVKSHDIRSRDATKYKNTQMVPSSHCTMSNSPSGLAHSKRKQEDGEQPDTSQKRIKTSSDNNTEFKFKISPPDFELELSNVLGRGMKKNPDLDLVIFKPFLSKSSAKSLYQYLLNSLPWYKVLSCS